VTVIPTLRLKEVRLSRELHFLIQESLDPVKRFLEKERE
jgi:hypothetical protein